MRQMAADDEMLHVKEGKMLNFAEGKTADASASQKNIQIICI